jgi:hypothetical protein
MSGYIGTQPVPQATQNRESFTATASQTSFATIGYTPQFLDVFLNGVHLLNGTDYTATNGSDVVLTTGAAAGDVLEVVSYTAFEAANVTGATDFTVTGSFTSRGIDDNATSTAMTLDSSGNLLVGATSYNNDNAGIGLGASNFFYATRSANIVASFNRLSTDGSIIDFRKDGSTVGSIGSVSGDMYIGTGDTGLRFHDSNNVVYPANQGAVVDATLDIGDANYRWKDLYLSGGVYLGGTGSANKLDDYEEGSWIPVVKTANAGSTLTYNTDYVFRSAYSTSDTNRIKYTKIGNRVFISFSFWSNISASYRFNISLPFAYLNSDYQIAAACSFYSINTAAGIGILGSGGSTFDTFALSEAGAHNNVSLQGSSEVYYNFSYETA